jgi:methylated-DNA-[protein]-cysteine S-methyltransferase
VLLQDDDAHVRALDWDDHEARMTDLLRRHYGARVELAAGDGSGDNVARLRRYFAGEIGALDEVPVATNGTPFQRAVWRELRAVRAGATISYAELARRIARPSAVRAVGHANGANPIGVVVPCHRVIGSDGSLTGYGGGLERKRWLLAHEAG